APYEDSSATGIDGDQGDQGDDSSFGAVYVFVRDGAGEWSQQAYVKPSNAGEHDRFSGEGLALSEDGNTLAVGASGEDSNATGIDGNQTQDSLDGAGAVYVFVRDGAGEWSQQAYVKASNPGDRDAFARLALSADGNTLAVAARFEDSSAPGIDGDQADNSGYDAGAAYVFVRDGADAWSQQAYIKASNPGSYRDLFGVDVALSSDGNTLAVGAINEDSDATGIDGDQGDDDINGDNSGAVYVFVRDGSTWSQQAYVKASNTDARDYFGGRVALSGDGNTLAVGAASEDSGATGIDGDQGDNTANTTGAVYVYVRDGMGEWSQQSYVKASNAEAHDNFGASVALNEDGNTLAVGARSEASMATGIDGDQGNGLDLSGAVYVFVRNDIGWSQRGYVKATNPGRGRVSGDSFHVVALSADGNTLAVGAPREGSSATGIDGGQDNDSARNSGAVYLY
ncbi:MAG: FG-GAP repeat protein, partial [Nannocystaceae bacterium]|nr:FG-GAP repeat protein [Nannocystaceae bacterium]